MTTARSAPPVRLASASAATHTLQERWIHLLARASADGADEPVVSPYLRHLLDCLTPFGARVLIALRDGPGGAQTMDAHRVGGTPWHYLGPKRLAIAVRLRCPDDAQLALVLEDLVGLGVVRRDDAHFTLSPAGVRLLIACGAESP
jgi:hypothetical protein